MSTLNKWKTILVASGLIGLGWYQITVGEMNTGMASIAAGLGLVFEGLRPD